MGSEVEKYLKTSTILALMLNFNQIDFRVVLVEFKYIYIWSLLYFVIVCKMCPDQTVTYCTDLWNIYELRNRCDTLASGSVINYYFLGTEKTRQKIHSKYVGVLSRAFV